MSERMSGASVPSHVASECDPTSARGPRASPCPRALPRVVRVARLSWPGHAPPRTVPSPGRRPRRRRTGPAPVGRRTARSNPIRRPRPPETMDTPEQRNDMPPQYDPHAAEERWYAFWLERRFFHSEPSDRTPYSIVLPPPNVTGALHAGHAFQQSLQDFLVRRARMQGFETLWLPGTDHAGIATQVVVERELAKEGIDRREMGRQAFLERVWQWKERYGGRIVEQMQALGNSCDWDRLRFTMDEGLSRAVRVAFVRMYDDGLIYRGERIINWCPKDRTALSDSEVEHDEVDGELVTFRYVLSASDDHIDVATTRVETMLGDTGVAVHPNDERYRALVGRAVRHPFDGRELPVVADDAVDPAFG